MNLTIEKTKRKILPRLRKVNSMKTNLIVMLLGACALIISACGSDAAAAAGDEITVEQAYTAAAMTLASQYQQTAQPTPTPPPTLMPTIAPTVTLISFNNLPTSTPFTTTYNTTISGSTGCDSSAYLSDVTIPDGTTLAPGESFTKTWSMQNIGTCDWTTSYSVVSYSGNSMSGSATALSDSVSSGGSIDVSVELVAPSTAGTYTGYWRLQNASGVSFGEAVYVQIVVSGSTATPTPTATTDGDESYTSTPTPTTAATATTAPTSTPTYTPVPTYTPTSEPTSTPVPTGEGEASSTSSS